MYTSILAVAAIFASAVSAQAPQDAWHVALLKRQAPGTPAYECHSNCGGAITLSRGLNYCQNPAFLTAYNACLACSGPGNQDIWRIYGNTLGAAGSQCGLSTTPLAAAASSTSASVPPAASATTAPTSSSIAAASTTTAPASSSIAAASTTTTSTPPATTTVRPANTTTSSPAQFTGAASSMLQQFAGISLIAALVLSAVMNF